MDGRKKAKKPQMRIVARSVSIDPKSASTVLQNCNEKFANTITLHGYE